LGVVFWKLEEQTLASEFGRISAQDFEQRLRFSIMLGAWSLELGAWSLEFAERLHPSAGIGILIISGGCHLD